MSRTPYKVHHWTVGSRFSVPLPATHIDDFTIEREPNSGQIFCAWVEDRGDGRMSVRWSRAPELYAAWRAPSSVAHVLGEVFAPELHFSKDRVLLTYLLSSGPGGVGQGVGECVLHWKRINGGPWSEGVLVRRSVAPTPGEASFPYANRLHCATSIDGRTWALLATERFVEPTYGLYPLNALERSLIPANPWEDEVIYTGVIATPADKARLVCEKDTWHIVRRCYDDRLNAYQLEAIALDLSILRHDCNDDGQSDVVDAILDVYNTDLTYLLWAECDYRQLFKEVGTVVAVRSPNQRSGRVDPSARHVFETAASLAHVRLDHPRGTPPLLEVVGHGQQMPIESIRMAASPVAEATQWQQRRPDSVTYAVECSVRADGRKWLQPGMIIAEAGVFANALRFEALVEWHGAPLDAGWRGHVHSLGSTVAAQIARVDVLKPPSRHRSATWIGKLYTHRISVVLVEPLPLTQSLRLSLCVFHDGSQFSVLGCAKVTRID